MKKLIPTLIAALFAVASSATLVQAAEPSRSAPAEMKTEAKAKAKAKTRTKAKSERPAKRNTTRKAGSATKK